MATHSTILAWRIPWTEEPGGLWSIALQSVGHDRSNIARTLSSIKACSGPGETEHTHTNDRPDFADSWSREAICGTAYIKNSVQRKILSISRRSFIWTWSSVHSRAQKAFPESLTVPRCEVRCAGHRSCPDTWDLISRRPGPCGLAAVHTAFPPRIAFSGDLGSQGNSIQLFLAPLPRASLAFHGSWRAGQPLLTCLPLSQEWAGPVFPGEDPPWVQDSRFPHHPPCTEMETSLLLSCWPTLWESSTPLICLKVDLPLFLTRPQDLKLEFESFLIWLSRHGEGSLKHPSDNTLHIW